MDGKFNNKLYLIISKATGMRKFGIDQNYLIEHWHMIYIMPLVF